MKTIPNHIDGTWVDASGPDSLPLTDPATGELLAHVPLSTREDVGLAVDAASRAFPDWRATPPVERARVLFRLKMLLEENLEELAVSLTREHGKNVDETRGEVRRGIENVEHACGVPTLMMGSTLEDVARGIDCETIRQPLGVFAGITPYNFPVMVPMWFWPYAVATGNTFVLKPSEQDVLTHQRVVELAVEAGLPRGVLNVVHGTQEAAVALLEHPGGRGQEPHGGASRRRLRTSDGSDRSVGLRLGRPALPGVDIGPVISAAHRERVAGFIDQGTRAGATLLLDGREADVPGLPQGHWIGPTVFEDVGPDMAIGQEEIFGPVAGLTRATSLDAAIELIDRNQYGNATSIFTTSGRAAREFRYHAGISMIGVNIGVAAPMAFFPFGGAKGSFYGDLKAQGQDAIEFYTDKRVVISKW